MDVRKLILDFFEENGVYIGEVNENDDIDLHAVSYTHLDVYKRQA